jgi:hypothetical protein
MKTLSLVQDCVRGWWNDLVLSQAPLIPSGQAEDDLLMNDSLCRVRGGTGDKNREAAPLQLSRPLQRGIDA